MWLPTRVNGLISILGASSLLGFGVALPTTNPPQPKPTAPVPQKQKQKAAPKAKTGEEIFKSTCAGCHGAKGEGGPGYNKPLAGSKSPAELANYIASAMPPGSKHTPKPQAELVAAHIYDAFYSPIAQERIRPARVALSRLTVKQFQNSVTDLIDPDRPAIPDNKERGLRATYFKSRHFDAKKGTVKRRDQVIDFDFDNKAPVEGDFEPHQFTISWEGSVIAPETGDYEFILKSDQAVRLYVNEDRTPVIDAWVKSGKDTTFKGSVHLMGGRAYFIKLDFMKATQGVDDSDKAKKKPPANAFVSLNWRRPHRAEEVIPTRFLMPDWSAPWFIVNNPFPPDDRSIGYERGTSVSKEWDEAVTTTVLDAARYVGTRINEITGNGSPEEKRKRAIERCKDFVSRAFRAPLTPEMEARYITKQFSGGSSIETCVKKVVLLTLKSPRFLYREIAETKPSPYTVASNLSFALWDTVPDRQLREAAANGQLNTPEQVRAQADRLINNPRSWSKMQDFLTLWLKVDEAKDLVKSSKQFPEFDEKVASDLRSSLEIYLEQTVWSEKSDYRELMTSNTAYLNGRLAKIYGEKLPANAPFTPVKADPTVRSGVLTQPYILARFAYLEGSSPIHRGVLIAKSFLGRTLAPPPAAFTPLEAKLHPGLTTRQRVALQTKPDACSGCHKMINPLGFTLEKYDALGRIRDQDNGKPIDSSGSYLTRSGNLAKFKDAADLANFLANSEEAHLAFTEKLFHHLVKQPVRAYGQNLLPKLNTSFGQNNYNIKRLMVQIVTETANSKPTLDPTK